MADLIITRHKALVHYLVEIGLAAPNTPVISHATADDVRGRHVIGVLPLWLAHFAASVTEVPLRVPADARGRELSLDEVRQWAGDPTTYVIHRISGDEPANA